MTTRQTAEVAKVLKKHFPNLTVEKTMEIVTEIDDAIESVVKK